MEGRVVKERSGSDDFENLQPLWMAKDSKIQKCLLETWHKEKADVLLYKVLLKSQVKPQSKTQRAISRD